MRVDQELTEPDDAGRAIRIGAEAQLRLEHDFGETCLLDRELCLDADDPSDPSAWQPLSADTRLDIPAVWVEVRGLPLGLSARAGRQLVLDTIGFARFDGVSVRMSPTRWLRGEVIAGQLVRATSFAGTTRSDPPGSVRLANADRVPWAAPASNTWVAGGNLAGGPGRWLQLSLGYRTMWDGDGNVLSRISFALTSQPLDWLRLDASGVWDLLTAELIDASARLHVGEDALRVHVGVDRRVPRFDPGTIWAWFTTAPITQGELGARWQPSGDFAIGGAVRARHAELGQEDPEDVDAGLDGWLNARWEGFVLDLGGFVWSGSLGPLAGVSVALRRRLLAFLELGLSATVWHFDDPHRTEVYGTVVSEVLEARVRLMDMTSLLIEFQHATSARVGHRFRGVLALRVDTWR